MAQTQLKKYQHKCDANLNQVGTWGLGVISKGESDEILVGRGVRGSVWISFEAKIHLIQR